MHPPNTAKVLRAVAEAMALSGNSPAADIAEMHRRADEAEGIKEGGEMLPR